jgi:ferritin-like metal-binding protein YciE
MTVNNLHDKFVYHLEEMYYVENQLVEVLGDLAAKVENDDLRKGLESHREQTRRHAGRLEEVFQEIDAIP